MSGIRRKRSPHRAGNVAQAGGLSAWEVYRTAALQDLTHASEHLLRYSLSTDEPAAGAVEAADLVDSALATLEGGA